MRSPGWASRSAAPSRRCSPPAGGASRSPEGNRQPGKAVPVGPRGRPTLARRVGDTLHINTLEGLEAAAHDGRLEQVSGFDHRRAAMVRAALAEMLARVRRSPLVRYEEPGSNSCWMSTENTGRGRLPES
jgi:hypothetical protein